MKKYVNPTWVRNCCFCSCFTGLLSVCGLLCLLGVLILAEFGKGVLPQLDEGALEDVDVQVLTLSPAQTGSTWQVVIDVSNENSLYEVSLRNVTDAKARPNTSGCYAHRQYLDGQVFESDRPQGVADLQMDGVDRFVAPGASAVYTCSFGVDPKIFYPGRFYLLFAIRFKGETGKPREGWIIK